MTRHFDPDNARGDGLYGLPHTPDEAGVVILPVPWEATASYGTGTARAAEAILAASPQVDLLDRETGRPYEAGIAMLPVSEEVARWNERARALAEPILAAGEAGDDPRLLEALQHVNELSGEMNRFVHGEATTWLDRGKLVGVLGGDHSAPFGLIRALAERDPGFGILHIDAHHDLRAAYEGFTWSHASIFHNVMERLPGVARLVQFGIRDFGNEEAAYAEAHADRIGVLYDADARARLLDGESWSALVDPLLDTLPERVYVSFDIDGLDPALCPHTGTPVPGGLSFPEATSLLRKVAAARTVIGFDLCEVAPDPTGATDWDANVGMRVLYKLIGFALASRA